jgi:hypothetical protein
VDNYLRKEIIMVEQNISGKQVIGEAAGQSNIKGVELNIQYPYFKARPTSLSRSFDSFIAQHTRGFVGSRTVYRREHDTLLNHSLEATLHLLKGHPPTR